MRSRVFVLVLGAALSTWVPLGATARADDGWRTITPADVTRAQWATAQKQAAAFMGHVGPSKNAGLVFEPSQASPPRDLDGKALAALVARLQRSFYVGDTAGTDVQLDGDVYFVPALEPSALQVRWLRVVDGKGKNVLVKQVDEGQPAVALHRDALSYQQEVKVADGATPVRAEGTATLRLPVSWTRVDLACKAGSSGRAKDVPVTVRACAGDFVQLDVGTPKRPVLVVTDAQGRAIASEFRETSPVFTGGRTFDQLKYEDLPVAPIAARVSYRTKGIASALSLYFVDRTEVRTFPVTAITPAAKGSTRTQYEPKVCTGLVRTTAQAVRADTHVSSTRSYAVSGYNTPEVRLTLPRLDNSFYAGIDVGDAKVTDAHGASVPHQVERGFLVWPSPSDDLRLVAPNGKPLAFAHASGRMKVHYPTEMRVVKLTKAAPRAGTLSLELRGTHAIVRDSRAADDGLRAPSFVPGCLDLVRGYDAHGERLVRLDQSERKGERDLTLWGTPAEVDVVVVDRWDDLPIDYDVTPAPLLPEGHEGETPE